MTSIKVYTTPTCPYCVMAKSYLESRGFEYEEVDVSQDHEAAHEMIEKTGHMGVPQLEVNGKMILGFKQSEIDNALMGAAKMSAPKKGRVR